MIYGLLLSNNRCPGIIGVSFLFFLCHCVCNVDLNCGDSEQGASVPDTAVQLQWSNAMFQTKDASHRTEGGPNQPNCLGNGARAT